MICPLFNDLTAIKWIRLRRHQRQQEFEDDVDQRDGQQKLHYLGQNDTALPKEITDKYRDTDRCSDTEKVARHLPLVLAVRTHPGFES